MKKIKHRTFIGFEQLEGPFFRSDKLLRQEAVGGKIFEEVQGTSFLRVKNQ